MGLDKIVYDKIKCDNTIHYYLRLPYVEKQQALIFFIQLLNAPGEALFGEPSIELA